MIRIGLRAMLMVLLGVLFLAGCSSTGGDDPGGDNGGADNGDNNGGGDDNGGGDADDDNNDGTDTDTDGEQPALIKTDISFSYLGSNLDASGKLDVGDDLIVYGIETRGIFYLVPSEVEIEDLPETGIQIPNSEEIFNTRSFVVTGKKVAMVRSNFAVSIFDTVTETLADIPAGQITLNAFTLPVEANKPGHMTADGPFVAAINDAGEVNDGNAIKVIDTSTATPVVISFPTPAEFVGSFNQVAVDAESRRVAAHGTNPDDMLYIWSIDEPNAAPLAYDFFERDGFSDNVQFRFDEDTILYQTGTIGGDWHIALLDVNTGTSTLFDNNPTQNAMPLALAGGSFGYFVWSENADMGPSSSDFRSAIGTLDDAPGATLASQFDVYPVTNETCVDGGKIGYGATIAVTPDGARWFLAGIGPVDAQYEELQMSTGGAFAAFEDTEDSTLTGSIMASDVVALEHDRRIPGLRQSPESGCLTNDDWVLGFIVLEPLDD